MADTNPKSRRQMIANLRIDEFLRFPLTERSKVSSQLNEIKATYGHKYKMKTENDEFTVTRIA